MRVAALRKGQRTPLLFLLLLAVMATLAAGIISTDGGRRPTASASGGPTATPDALQPTTERPEAKMSSIADEETRILIRLGEIKDKGPETPEAALATALIMLNRKLDMILIQLQSRPPA